jgi:predicted secreted protein
MATAGNNMKLYLTTEGMDELTWITGEQTSSINLSADLLEVSDKSTKWKQYIPSIKGATIDATFFAEYGNTQQSALMESLMVGSKVYAFVGEVSEDKPKIGYFFAAYVASISDSFDNAGVVSRSVSLQITGEVETYG